MKSFLLAISFVFLSLTAIAQKDYQKELVEPMIEIVGDDYVIEEFMIIKSNGDSVQMHLKSQMPQDCMVHRDRLIAMTTMFMTKLTDEISANGEVEEIDSLIGDADIVIKIFVTDDGLQLAISAAGETKRETLSWKQVYEEI
ncbi:hypothetical protein FNJ87_04495 [Nonlabens mediterrranea]|uniref:DUF4252 domain-containing protein n=1 Tax=Nonlabens mediterrranea TaxID=1419947 RepID=A0ABS0A2M5_9FLAO|nr:hypothetical protein [Nonlabens mediterrranea]